MLRSIMGSTYCWQPAYGIILQEIRWSFLWMRTMRGYQTNKMTINLGVVYSTLLLLYHIYPCMLTWFSYLCTKDIVLDMLRVEDMNYIRITIVVPYFQYTYVKYITEYYNILQSIMKRINIFFNVKIGANSKYAKSTFQIKMNLIDFLIYL